VLLSILLHFSIHLLNSIGQVVFTEVIRDQEVLNFDWIGLKLVCFEVNFATEDYTCFTIEARTTTIVFVAPSYLFRHRKDFLEPIV
jgi:hypothetical protein